MKGRLIDVREYPEYAAGHIDGSESVPLGTLDKASEGWDRSAPVDVLCRFGRRAQQAKKLLDSKGFSCVEVISGGIDALQRAGKPVYRSANTSWNMERQVRVTAGALVLSFVSLGAFASKKFYLGAGLIGAGLVYAGVSDTCMMASLLARMPWNESRT